MQGDIQLNEVGAERGVRERSFELQVGDERVPGLLWTPVDAVGPRPLILLGHGGSQHKRTDIVLAIARRIVRHHGYAAASIDAPDHGARITAEAAERQRVALRGLQPGAPLQPLSIERFERMVARGSQVAGEWRAVLDALLPLPGIEGGPVGYWGLSMGTAFGVPTVAAEPRIRAAIFGLFGAHEQALAFEQSARAVTVPVLFILQLDDELITPEAGLALFRAFGSKVKTMHMNPGSHIATPAFEREDYETFFVRHLGAVQPAG